MLQFSLRNLLIGVTVIAVGTAALLNANEWWASLLWALALLLLVFAGLVAIFRRESQRAFAFGYVFAGGLYLALLIYSVPNGAPATYWMPYSPLAQENLFTTKVVSWVYTLFPASKTTPYLPPPGGGGGAGAATPAMGGFFGGGGFGGAAAQTPNPSYVDYQNFLNVGQALWMLLLPWLGGTVAARLISAREKSKTSTTPVRAPSP
ncbi:MAG: hypothetical protein ACKVP0_05315 [Pirellulaceae bacterium]